MVVQYMPETELRAGRIFAAAMRGAGAGPRVVKITPATSREQLDSIARLAADAERVVLAAYVRRIEGEGRPAILAHVDCSYLSARVNSLLHDMERGGIEVVNLITEKLREDEGAEIIEFGGGREREQVVSNQ